MNSKQVTWGRMILTLLSETSKSIILELRSGAVVTLEKPTWILVDGVIYSHNQIVPE